MFRRWSLVVAGCVAGVAWADVSAGEPALAALPVVVVTGVGRPGADARTDAPLAIAVFAGGEALRDQWRREARLPKAVTAADGAPESVRVRTAGR